MQCCMSGLAPVSSPSVTNAKLLHAPMLRGLPAAHSSVVKQLVMSLHTASPQHDQ